MADKKFVFVLTSSYDRPDAMAGALQLATNMKAFDIELDFFLMDNAALLAKAGFAETITWQRKNQFSPMAELIGTLVDLGVKFYVCASCVKAHQLDTATLIENAEIKPGTYLAEMLLERQSLTF